VIFRETRHYAQTHVISGALCPFSGREKNTGSRTFGLISVAIVCYGYLCWDWLLLFLLFLNSLLTSLAFAPDCNVVSAIRISINGFIHKFFRPLLETRNPLPYLDYYVWLGKVSET